MFAEGVIQATAPADVVHHRPRDSFDFRILGLPFQNLQHPHHGHPGPEHGFELLGKDDEFGRFDRREHLLQTIQTALS